MQNSGDEMDTETIACTNLWFEKYSILFSSLQ